MSLPLGRDILRRSDTVPLTITQVDAFTGEPFGGNPAAVCLLPHPADAAWMQRVAREMNLSETAFLFRRDDGAFDLRWFTPARRGRPLRPRHAGERPRAVGREPPCPGPARRLPHPLRPPVGGPARRVDRNGLPGGTGRGGARPRRTGRCLGTEPTYVGRNRFDYLVAVDAEATVRRLAPDFRRLGAIDARGVIVTARAETDGFDFVSRFFAPRTGIDEDPVTGSAHCCLGHYWRRRLGRDTFTAWQASARGGLVRVAVRGERVTLSGQAVTVFRGELLARRRGR